MFELGLIEGFYGRLWTWEQRRNMAIFLREHSYRTYIYAPKGDVALRGQWREPFTGDWLAAVREWAAHCRGIGLRWGLGLSPLGLQGQYGDADRAALCAKLAEIETLGPDCLWLLFDDMRGDLPGLAANQCAVIGDARRVFSGEIAICPSYYSFDPVLDEVFGDRPPHYLEELGRELPPDVNMLWTGDRVISTVQDVASCERFTALSGRRPLLWDNYPVNDGARTADFLHLDAFRDRSPALEQATVGHYVNPMVQCELSKLALATLPACYQDGYDADQARDQSFAQLPADLAAVLAEDWRQFQERGRQALQPADPLYWQQRYGPIEHPVAQEVRRWLKGEYAFDPACLTG